MPAIKYSAEHNGQIFTRKSQRTYTHTVVARRNMDAAIKCESDKAWNKVAFSNHAFFSQEANPATRKHSVTPEQEARYQAIAAMTKEQYAESLMRERLARIEKNRLAGDYDRMVNLGWCGRPDLAQKLAAKERASGWYLDVTILEAKAAP